MFIALLPLRDNTAAAGRSVLEAYSDIIWPHAQDAVKFIIVLLREAKPSNSDPRPELKGKVKMRIWDIPSDKLCRAHLLGEHNELHAIWNILTQGRKGYSAHPETKRWEGKLKALFRVHEEIVREMLARGYRHQSPLDKTLATGRPVQTSFEDNVARQIEILKRGCDGDVKHGK